MQPIQRTKFLVSCFILLFITSCDNTNNTESLGPSILQGMQNGDISYRGSRSFKQYRQEETLVSFTVIYKGDFTQITSDGNSSFRALLETYNLEVRRPFEVNKENQGFILVPTTPLVAPIEVGKEISLLDDILMVTVDNLKTDAPNPS
ncbi:MAG: Unknown protein [uncultured Aureispira sp.]|uniref:Uncharacterized protein n=1 Tax=uncultured Aureispira sp. TaxID=1331704 RepID=A0A6S6TX05_9BACT|nr:MAG: Unknown protein [uncultured Aureispira sp.]